MPETQAKAVGSSRRRWRHVLRVVLVLVVTVTLGSAVLQASKTVGSNRSPVGFTHGVFHGALMPCALPALLLGQDVAIYAAHNDGRGYKLGYTVGVNGCGLLFFGLLFWRLNRFRHKMTGLRGTRSDVENLPRATDTDRHTPPIALSSRCSTRSRPSTSIK